MKKLILSTLFLYGCSSGYPVTYDSFPQSAVVVCNNQQKGYTPVTLYYPEESAKTGRLITQPCYAYWASGHQAIFNDQFDTNQFPDGVRTYVKTPSPDNRDILFDNQRKQIQYQNLQMYNLQNTPAIVPYQPHTTYCNKIGFQTMCNTY